MKAKLNTFDRLVSFFAPQAGLRRARARALHSILAESGVGKRGYDGASVGRRTGGWKASSTSANTEIFGSLTHLRNRSRDMVRNDPFAARAAQAVVANAVGTGIVPRARHRTEKRASRAQDLWKQWAETTACDFYGIHNIYGLQALAWRGVFESGEVLIRRIRTPSSAKLPVPLQIQVLEPDYIDSLRTNLALPDGGYVIQGVEFDKTGKKVAYWLFKQHPGEVAFPFGGLTADRVPASEVKHVYRQDRPGQVRGVPHLAPVILKLRDFNEYEDAQLVRQKIAACFAAFVVDQEDLTDPTTGAAKNPLSERVEPGMIQGLPPGRDIKFGNPPGVDGYGDYSRAVLRGISAGLNIPYEVLTGDLSQVNFSSARLGWLEFHRCLNQWNWGMFIPQFCDEIWDWFIEAAILVDDSVEDVDVEWCPPKREMINPTEESKAAIISIRAGLQSRSEFIRSSGGDPEQVDQDIADDNKRADELGLVLDSDPRKLSQVGQVQQSNQAGDSAPADNKGESA